MMWRTTHLFDCSKLNVNSPLETLMVQK